ncbi:MAG: hypothetical protein ACPGJV_02590 [Bacteriovoracaceae bacterium]
MSTKQEENILEAFSEVADESGYLKLSKVSGEFHYDIDTHKERPFIVEAKVWLKWNNVFFTQIPVTSKVAKRIKKIASMIKNRKSQLYKCFEIKKELKCLARVRETGEEGIFSLGSRMYIEALEDAYKNNKLHDHSMRVSTVATLNKVTRVPVMVERTVEEYRSDLSLPQNDIDVPDEIIDLYISTVEKLAKGQSLEVEKVRKQFEAVWEKHQEDSDGGEDLSSIFNSSEEQVNESTGEITNEDDYEYETTEEVESTLEEVQEKFKELISKAKLKIPAKVEKKMDDKTFLLKEIERLEQKIGA